MGAVALGVMEVPLIYSVLLFVFGIAMGIGFIWDIGGVASRMHAQLERDPKYDGLYKPWWPRAFGVWAILFSVGQLVYFYGFTHGMWS
jgi:hypothetical protein